MDLGLKGQSVLITGGSQGIGLATARAFAAESCSLHLAARTKIDLQAARDSIVADFGVEVPFQVAPLRRSMKNDGVQPGN